MVGKTKNEKSQTSLWSIRGVSHETRIAAKKAAKKEDKKLFEWVEEKITEAAHQVLSRKTVLAKPDDVIDLLKSMSDKIEKLSYLPDKVEELSKRKGQGFLKRLLGK